MLNEDGDLQAFPKDPFKEFSKSNIKGIGFGIKPHLIEFFSES